MIGDVARRMRVTCLTGDGLWHQRGSTARTGARWSTRCGNWYTNFTLAGRAEDFIVEQHCHNMDKAAWVFGEEDGGLHKVDTTGGLRRPRNSGTFRRNWPPS